MITTFGGSFLTSFGGFWASLLSLHHFEKTPPTIITETLPDGEFVQRWTNSFKRMFIFSSVVAGSALFVFPLIQLMNPAIVGLAISTTFLTSVGSSLYTLSRRPGEFKIWESALYGSLTGLIGINVLPLIAGPGSLTAAGSSQGFYGVMRLIAAFHA